MRTEAGPTSGDWGRKGWLRRRALVILLLVAVHIAVIWLAWDDMESERAAVLAGSEVIGGFAGWGLRIVDRKPRHLRVGTWMLLAAAASLLGQTANWSLSGSPYEPPFAALCLGLISMLILTRPLEPPAGISGTEPRI